MVIGLKEVTIESYNKTAEKYARDVANLHPQKESKIFRSYLKESSLILDLGCGSGRDAKVFTEKGYKVIGIDLSEELINIARRDAPKADFRLMDIVNLEFPDNYFDGVWAVSSLIHIAKNDISNVLEGIYKTLKKEGIFHLAVKEGTGEILMPDERYGGVKKFWSFFQKDEIEHLVKDANFTLLPSHIQKKNNSYATNPWICLFCQKLALKIANLRKKKKNSGGK